MLKDITWGVLPLLEREGERARDCYQTANRQIGTIVAVLVCQLIKAPRAFPEDGVRHVF